MGTAFKAALATAVIALAGTSAMGMLGHAFTPDDQTEAVDKAKVLLEPWNIAQIKVRDQNLIIKVDVAQVTEDLYLTVIANGICSSASVAAPLRGIREVRVLDRRGTRGYVYTHGFADCEEIAPRPEGDNRTTLDILSHTEIQAPNVLGI